MTAPQTTTDRDEALAFITAMQADPATACAYLGDDPDDVAESLDDLDQPLLQTLRVVRDADGRIRSAVCVEWDEESDMAWVYGPWCEPQAWATDGPALLAAVAEQAPVAKLELYAATANRPMAELAERAGWRAGVANHVFETPRKPLAQGDPDVRPATSADLEQLRALHDAAFPDTYATARQLVDPDGEYTTLVLERDGELLGYVAGKPDGDDAYLDYVATAPAARRQGIGTRLLGALADALPGESLTLTVADTAAEAVALYEKLGWDRTESTRGYRWPAS